MNKTILKWAGSKVRLMPQLAAHLPAGQRLVEPFAGSCAVMMNTDYPAYLVADINPDLINLYRQVKEHTRPFIVLAFQTFRDNHTGAGYKRVRYIFNHNPQLTLLQRAVYFLFLNRHGHQGMCRYNQSGEFNIPYGHYAKPYFPEAEIVTFAEKAVRAEFVCAHYTETLTQRVMPGDVVYCDPPYSGTFSTYHTSGFTDEDHARLAALLRARAQRNPVIVSNSDTPLTRDLYSRFSLTSVSAPRSLGVKTGIAKGAAEIIATLNPPATPAGKTGTYHTPVSDWPLPTHIKEQVSHE